MEAFHKRMREARQKAGISQDRMTVLLTLRFEGSGITTSRELIRRMEGGQPTPVREETVNPVIVAAWADECGTTVEDLSPQVANYLAKILAIITSEDGGAVGPRLSSLLAA